MNEIDGHPERIIPDETPPGIVALHLKRYDFARDYVSGKKVLDIACGVGYGAAFLCQHAAEVLGVDLEQEAIAYAVRRYGGPRNLAFARGDAMCLELQDAGFEAVCSFETIEHVGNVDKYLQEIKRVLMPGGIYLVSTPAAMVSTTRPMNPHHVQEWTPRDFVTLLGRYFEHVEIFSEMRKETFLSLCLKNLDLFRLRTRLRSLGVSRSVAKMAGVRTTADLRMDDIVIAPGLHRRATEVIAVCRKAPVSS